MIDLRDPVVVIVNLIAIFQGVAVIAGGIVLFATGRSRGALPGFGFVVLAISTFIGTIWSFMYTWLTESQGMSVDTTVLVQNVLSAVFDIIGWALVLFALVRLRGPHPEPTSAGPQPGAPAYGAPRGGPGPGYRAPSWPGYEALRGPGYGAPGGAGYGEPRPYGGPPEPPH